MRLRSLFPSALVAAITFGSSLLSASTCKADPTDVVTYNFAGSVSCFSLTCPPGTTVTGTYSFDPDTESIVGAWSFSTPDGTISSTEVGSSTLVQEGGVAGLPPGFDVFFFEGTGGKPFLGLVFADPQDGGNLPPFTETTIVSDLIGTAGNFTFTSGAAMPAPEPASLFLLGTGLLGLGPFLRRRVSVGGSTLTRDNAR